MVKVGRLLAVCHIDLVATDVEVLVVEGLVDVSNELKLLVLKLSKVEMTHVNDKLHGHQQISGTGAA